MTEPDGTKPLYYGGTFVKLLTDAGIFIEGTLRSFDEAKVIRDQASGVLRDEITEALDAWERYLRGTGGLPGR
jgi:hypothetical protein